MTSQDSTIRVMKNPTRKRPREESDEDDRRSVPRSGPAVVITGTETQFVGKVVHVRAAYSYKPPLDGIAVESWVSVPLIDYIRKLVDCKDREGVRYHVHRLPVHDVDWHVVGYDPLIEHKRHLGKPLLVWVVASLIDANLEISSECPWPRLHVVVNFLRERDRLEATAHLNAASTHAIEQLTTLTVMSAAEANEGPPSYDRIYDARHDFCARHEMGDVQLVRLRPGDLVLLECTLVVRQDNYGTKVARYVLDALYWLAEKPRKFTSVFEHVHEHFHDVISLSDE